MSDTVTNRNDADYRGLLFIGDPHLEGRVPSFRCDDFPNVVLGKLKWALDYAADNRLLPALLGDLFQVPRDNPNWLIVELLEMFDREVLAIYGNHDIRENELTDHDSFSILLQAGRLRLLTPYSLWRGDIGGRHVIVGGNPWGSRIDAQQVSRLHELRRATAANSLMIWLMHVDAGLETTDAWQTDFRAFPADIVVNGHIHRRCDPIEIGSLTWLTPGNITRRTRSDANREHRPSVLELIVEDDRWRSDYVEIPHRPFAEVFHPQVADEQIDHARSAFVAGLAELEARRTETGAGLHVFLESNLEQFEPQVADEIRRLAEEVIGT